MTKIFPAHCFEVSQAHFILTVQLLKKYRSLKGVKEASGQLFIASFSADCCSLPIQLIGFDPQTDFVIQPWLSTKLGGDISDGEVVVGSGVNADKGDTLKFFNRDYRVAARLDKTGMGFDTSVFMNMNTAKTAILDYVKMGRKATVSVNNSISSVVVKVENGYSVSDVSNSITKSYGKEGVDVVVSKNIITSISSGLNTLLLFILVLAIILWVLAIAVISIVFSVSLNERKKEFGILRSLGATRKKLSLMILFESSLISLTGALIGILFASIFFFPFSTYIGVLIKMPYLQPSISATVLIFIASLAVSFVVGPIASLYSAIKIGRSETYTMIRQEE